jgi:hypothetical protein
LEERVIKIGVKEVKIFIRLKEFSFIIIYFHLLTSNYVTGTQLNKSIFDINICFAKWIEEIYKNH